jgi:hypothetical protein
VGGLVLEVDALEFLSLLIKMGYKDRKMQDASDVIV